MAESIGGILISVGMNTSEYEKGVKKVKDSEAEIYKIEKDYRIKSAEQEQRIENALKNAQEADDKLFLAQQKLKKNATKENQKAVADLKKEYEKLLKAHDKEVGKLEVLNAKREESLKIAKEELATQQKQLANTGKFQKFKNALGGIKGVLAGGVVMGAVAGLDRFMGKLDALAKRAKDVGMTASQLQELEHQAKLAGMEAGNLDSAVKTFNKNISLAGMGTGEAKDAIAQMGISLKDANGATKTQSQLLKEVALKFAETAGSAENAGRATKIFGDSGAEMLRIFEQGEGVINKVFDAKAIDHAAEAAERYKDNIERVSNWSFGLLANVVDFGAAVVDEVEGLWENGKFGGAAEAEAKRVQEANNKAVKAQQDAIEKAEKARIQKVRDAIAKADEEMRASEKAELSARDKVLNLTLQEERLSRQLLDLDEDSDEYAKLYAERVKVIISLKKEEKKLDEEIANKTKKAADERKKALEDQKKKLETELKSKKERFEQMQTTREEFELNLEIQKLENGSERQKAQAEAIKNGLKRNELMQKYGYSLEEANKKMREMLKLEADKNNKGKDGKGKFEYSEEDVERAKRLLKRGEGGTVGKKSLEQAQKIVNGEDIGDTEYSGFIGAKKRAKEVKQNNDVGIASNAEINAVKPKTEQGKGESDLPKTMQDLSKEIKNLSKEIKDLKNVTRDSANNKKD